MRTNFDFSPYRRSTVGFDRLFDLLESGGPLSQADNYPPFDLVRVSDDEYRITLAVAGFGADEIEITAQQADHAHVVKAHYELASAYLDRIHGDAPRSDPNFLEA